MKMISRFTHGKAIKIVSYVFSFALIFSAVPIYSDAQTVTGPNPSVSKTAATCSDGLSNCGYKYIAQASGSCTYGGATVVNNCVISGNITPPSDSNYNITSDSYSVSQSSSGSSDLTSTNMLGASISYTCSSTYNALCESETSKSCSSYSSGTAIPNSSIYFQANSPKCHNSVGQPVGNASFNVSATWTMCAKSANGKAYTESSSGVCAPAASCSASLAFSAAGQVTWAITNGGGSVTIKNSGGTAVASGSTNTGTANYLSPGVYTLTATGASGYGSCSAQATILSPALTVTASDAIVTTGTNPLNFQYTNTGPSKTTLHVDSTGCSAVKSVSGITINSVTCTTVDMAN